MTMKRRTFLVGAGAGVAAAAMPFDLWRKKRAEAAGLYTRYSTSSTEGAAMLQVYAQAVAAMKALPTSDPRSWVFQWYTHWVDGTTTKDAAIQAAYGSASSPQRDLAVAMWDTCQGHGRNPVEYFVVWHRMFVFYFEEIVRSISGNAAFTLPYWPYDQTDQQSIPVAFRSSSNPLYVANRNSGINNGARLDADGRSPLSFKCMAEKTFLPSAGSLSAGFNSSLNQNPHGTVHVDVGTSTNMGQIPYAAQDPVFYVHHCEVDRLWASWNAAGGQNPTNERWLDQTFTFADAEGTMVKATNRDFLSTDALGYKYDTLMDIPPIEGPAAMVMAQSAEAPMMLSVGAAAAAEKSGPGNNMLSAEIEGALSLGDQPTTVKIPQPKSMSLMGALSESLSQKEPKVFVVLRDIYAKEPPGSGFGVYINLPEGTAPTPEDPHYVGSINFFNATVMPGGDGMFMVDTYVLDVTQELKKLREAKGLGDDVSVTVAPFGMVAPGSAPKVGRIEFVIE